MSIINSLPAAGATASRPYKLMTTEEGYSQLASFLTYLQTGADAQSLYVERVDPAPGSGYFFFAGLFLNPPAQYNPLQSFGQVLRRTSDGVVGMGAWSASTTIPSGAVFKVWSLDGAFE